MGMFDEIEVKQTLPLPEEIKDIHDWQSYVFQTKDLDCTLSRYIIRDGKLYARIVEMEYEYYTDEERKELQKSTRWAPVIKSSKEISSTEEEQDFHGKLRFCTYDQMDAQHDYWVDFEAYFIYGKLDKIELVEFEKRYIEDRDSWKKVMQKKAKHPWNRFKFYAGYLGWTWFWVRVARTLNKCANFISKLQTLIYRYLV
jgi:hypothetical protein